MNTPHETGVSSPPPPSAAGSSVVGNRSVELSGAVVPGVNPRHQHEPVELHELILPNSRGADYGQKDAGIAALRAELLGRLARGEVKPLIMVYGQSSSGKSSVMGMLADAGVKPSVRLLTRQPRSTDGLFEHHWSRYLSESANNAAPANSPDIPGEHRGMFSPDKVIFAIYNYGSYYATSGEDLQRLLADPETQAASVLMGKLLDLPNMKEAVDNVTPLLPVVSIRLDVPPFLLSSRLSRRGESSGGENATRISKLMDKYVEDQLQMGTYAKIYGLRVLPNALPSEISDFHLEGLHPLTPERLQATVERAVTHSVEESSRQAQDILKPRVIAYDCGVVPDRVIKGIVSVLLPIADEVGVSELYAKGGFAVAAYLGSHSRRISPDIDFTVATSKDQVLALVRLHDELDRQFGTHEPDASVNGKLQARWGTKDYHILSRKSRILLGAEGARKELEVDGIALTRIQPEDRGFCFEFGCDHGDRILSRQVCLPNDKILFILPPEHLVVEKLLAAREPTNGGDDPSKIKFDLFDVAGLISTQDMNPNLLHKLVFQQQYRPELDRDVVVAVNGLKQRLSGTSICSADELLTALGYNNSLFPQAFRSRSVDLDKPVDGPDDNDSRSTLSLTAIKHLVMLTRMEQSLDRIKEILGRDFKVYFGMTQTMAETFGQEKINERIAGLKEIVHAFRTFQVGRGDIFVRRQLVSADELRFFEHLQKEYPQLDVSSL